MENNNSNNSPLYGFWLTLGMVAVHIYCYMQVGFYLWNRFNFESIFGYLFFLTAWGIIGETVSVMVLGSFYGVYILIQGNNPPSNRDF